MTGVTRVRRLREGVSAHEGTQMKLGLVGAGRIGEMHARILAALSDVEALLVADVRQPRAAQVAAGVGAPARAVGRVDDLFDADLDGLVIAAATDVHADLITRAVGAELPVFCEKPVAGDVAGARRVVELAERAGAYVQVGFQRRFDPGHVAAREAVRAGRLGFLHTIRCTTLDPAPPTAVYVAASGGLYRDCGVHDFDAVGWVTGHAVTEVYATGANRGADYFRDAGDVDTAAAVLTLADGTLVVFSATRYNAAGYDVRLELLGERDSVVAGLDDSVPLRSLESDVSWPAGPAAGHFTERFRHAYVAEMRTFVDVVAHGGAAAVPDGVCTPRQALEAFYVAEACELSRAEDRPVRVDEVRRDRQEVS